MHELWKSFIAIRDSIGITTLYLVLGNDGTSSINFPFCNSILTCNNKTYRCKIWSTTWIEISSFACFCVVQGLCTSPWRWKHWRTIVNILRFSHHATSIPTNLVRSSRKQKLYATKPKWKSKLIVVNCSKLLFFESNFPILSSHVWSCQMLRFLGIFVWLSSVHVGGLHKYFNPIWYSESIVPYTPYDPAMFRVAFEKVIDLHPFFFISLTFWSLFLFLYFSIHVI
jgi:hypothetical protein